MEVGAVKQAFNNEIILIKKNLNQARIQIIHKLTRKAKTLVEKKATEKLKEKFKKKAESAVKEVMIIKKIKAKDIAKFIVTHEGELNSYLNKPNVNQEKACARLLLHKSLQEKYKYIRDRFGNSSIQDLFMSRLERRKIKKEAREKQKNKKKGKEALKSVNTEGDWVVQDVLIDKNTNVENNETKQNDEDVNEVSASNSEQSEEEIEKSEGDLNNNSESDEEKNDDDLKYKEIDDNNREANSNIKTNIRNIENSSVNRNNEEIGNKKEIDDDNIEANSNVKTNLRHIEKSSVNMNNDEIRKRKRKDANKNKNFNEKILKRKFNKVVDDEPVQELKIADPFFITQTGESYMSVVEPRQPDEVKEVHKEGNRKYRRAVMFGHVPKLKRKPRRDEFQQENRRFKDLSNTSCKFSNSDRRNNQFRPEVNEKPENEKVEKLHPSWEAKKRKSGILPFEGKKIVFDEA